MKTKKEIVQDWLPRYTGTPLEDFGKYILLVNFGTLAISPWGVVLHFWPVLLVALGVTLAVFLLIRLIPGTIVDQMIGTEGSYSEETVRAQRALRKARYLVRQRLGRLPRLAARHHALA